MKKSMMILMALVVTSLCQAQVFEFRYGGQALEDQATVTIQAEADSFFPDQKNCATNPATDPKNGLVLVVLDGSVKSGNATMEILSNTLNPTTIQWCMGGVCELMNNKTSLEKTFSTGSDGVTQVEFDATNVAAEGLLEARLTAKIGEETKTVTIKFVSGTATGITPSLRDSAEGRSYGLDGVEVKTSSGKRGFFIRDGKKYLRK